MFDLKKHSMAECLPIFFKKYQIIFYLLMDFLFSSLLRVRLKICMELGFAFFASARNARKKISRKMRNFCETIFAGNPNPMANLY